MISNILIYFTRRKRICVLLVISFLLYIVCDSLNLVEYRWNQLFRTQISLSHHSFYPSIHMISQMVHTHSLNCCGSLSRPINYSNSRLFCTSVSKSRKSNGNNDNENDVSKIKDEEGEIEIEYDMLMKKWISAGHDQKSFTIEKAIFTLFPINDDDDDDMEYDLGNAINSDEIKKATLLNKQTISSSKSSTKSSRLLRKSLLSNKQKKSMNDSSKLSKRSIDNQINTKSIDSTTLQSSNITSIHSNVKNKKKSVGIDLGTTNSVVSIIENGMPIVIPIDSNRITPSVVAYSNINSNFHSQSDSSLLSSSITVGQAAKIQLLLNPKNTYSSVKRLMGQGIQAAGSSTRIVSSSSSSSSSSINSYMNQLISRDPLTAMKLRKDGTRKPSIVDRRISLTSNNSISSNINSSLSSERLICPVLGRDLSPEEVSAEIVKKLLIGASQYLGSNITNAVITIPAYFSKEQCQATEKAGLMAGLEKVKLLREPEAAALAYGLTRKDPQVVLVFDLGGGTFDVSILEVGGGFVEVIATSGDSHLGGDDFDAAIAKWLIDSIAVNVTTEGLTTAITKEISPATVANQMKKDPFILTQIYQAAEKAKMELSFNRSTTITIANPLSDGRNFTLELTRTKFESLTKSLLQKLLRPLREAALMAGINLPGESGQVGIDESIAYDSSRSSSNNDNNDDESQDRSDVEVMKKNQLEGRKLAKEKQKVKGKSTQELRRLQKAMGLSQLSLFPSGQMLDEVILVGGATRMPAVKRMVRVMTGIDPKSTVNVDEAVSLGAAVMAGILDGEITDMQVMNAWQAAMYRAFATDSTTQR